MQEAWLEYANETVSLPFLMSVWTLLVTQDVMITIISRDGKILLTNASISDLEKWPRRSAGIERHRRQLQTVVTDKQLWRKTVVLSLWFISDNRLSNQGVFWWQISLQCMIKFHPLWAPCFRNSKYPFLCEFTIIKNNELVSACVSVKDLRKVKR